MGDATVEILEQGGGLVGDVGGFEVGAGEVADGVEGSPVGFDDNFDFVFEAAKGCRRSEVARDAAKLGQNTLGKMFEIPGPLCFGAASRPAAQDRSRCGSRGSRGPL